LLFDEGVWYGSNVTQYVFVLPDIFGSILYSYVWFTMLKDHFYSIVYFVTLLLYITLFVKDVSYI